jgi:nucleoside-diphosphate-sugar epimerase
MQTILGANGVIGTELSRHLLKYTDRVRQVSRNPKAVNASDELMNGDLLNAGDVRRAVAGSEVVYLLAGLKYDVATWQDQWPRIMSNVIDACKASGSKLVFFDNVYAYGLVRGVMTEETPFNPCSKKGEVRAQIATRLLDEIKKNNIQGLIVRAADFYGPEVKQSMIHATVVERLRAGKTPQWIGNPKRTHSFTYTPDAGRSVAILGNAPAAINQTWHALTSKEQITGEAFVRLACEMAGRPYAVQALPKFGVRMIGLFVPVLREIVEMMYQYDEDYLFDSTKMEKVFNEQPTPYKDGIAQIIG